MDCAERTKELNYLMTNAHGSIESIEHGSQSLLNIEHQLVELNNILARQ